MDSDVLRIIYWCMAGGGTLLMVLFLLLGAEHDLAHDTEFHIGPIAFGHGSANGGDGGPSPISVRTIMAFIGGWGWGGLIGLELGWGFVSLPFGLAVGVALAFVVFQFMRLLYAQEATSTVGVEHMLGQEGVVMTRIPSQGTGEVRVTVRGTTVKSLARSESDEEIAEGRRVRVVEELGGRLIVRPVE